MSSFTTNPYYDELSSYFDFYKHINTKIMPPVFKEETLNKSKAYDIKKIIVNGNTTIVFWEDGSEKTIVKLAEGDTYSLEYAVARCITKKLFKSNSAFKKMIKKLTYVQPDKNKTKESV